MFYPLITQLFLAIIFVTVGVKATPWWLPMQSPISHFPYLNTHLGQHHLFEPHRSSSSSLYRQQLLEDANLEAFLHRFFEDPIYSKDPLKYLLTFQESFVEQVCPRTDNRVDKLCELFCHPMLICAGLCEPQCPQYEATPSWCVGEIENAVCDIFCGIDAMRCMGVCSPRCKNYKDSSDCPNPNADDVKLSTTVANESHTAAAKKHRGTTTIFRSKATTPSKRSRTTPRPMNSLNPKSTKKH